MIDTHSHIYLPDFDPDRPDVLDRAALAGLSDIFMPAIGFDSFPGMQAMEHPKIRFHAMAGIHPCEIGETAIGPRHPESVRLAEWAASDRIVAIGESGLDYYWSREFIRQQQESLRFHCRLARELGKPIILHNRNSTSDLLNIIEQEQDGRLTGIWHCFNGTSDEGRRAIDLGLTLGIGGVITFKNAGVDRTVATLPPGHMVLETDAPYLTPAPHRGKRNEPAYLRLVVEKMSGIFQLPEDEIIRITTENAKKVFRMAPQNINSTQNA